MFRCIRHFFFYQLFFRFSLDKYHGREIISYHFKVYFGMFGIIFDSLPLCVCMSCAKMLKKVEVLCHLKFLKMQVLEVISMRVVQLTCSSCLQILILKKNDLILLITIVKVAILGVFLLKSVISPSPVKINNSISFGKC